METRVLTNPGADDKDIFIEFVLFIRRGYRFHDLILVYSFVPAI
jgi:hypothetical protein